METRVQTTVRKKCFILLLPTIEVKETVQFKTLSLVKVYILHTPEEQIDSANKINPQSFQM